MRRTADRSDNLDANYRQYGQQRSLTQGWRLLRLDPTWQAPVRLLHPRAAPRHAFDIYVSMAARPKFPKLVGRECIG